MMSPAVLLLLGFRCVALLYGSNTFQHSKGFFRFVCCTICNKRMNRNNAPATVWLNAARIKSFAKMSAAPNVQVSDTTGDATYTVAGHQHYFAMSAVEEKDIPATRFAHLSQKLSKTSQSLCLKPESRN